jgi:hypothetical protein
MILFSIIKHRHSSNINKPIPTKFFTCSQFARYHLFKKSSLFQFTSEAKMHFSTLTLLAASALGVSANPLRNVFERETVCPPCVKTTSYSVTHQYDWKSSPLLIRGPSCEGVGDNAPCQLQQGYEFSVGTSIDVGASLGLDFKEIFNAGVSGSVSYEQSRSTSVSVTVTCPPNVQCGFLHQDAITVVQGYKRVYEDCGSRSLACGSGAVNQDLSNDYYSVDMPKLGDNGFPITEIMACACPDSDMSNKPYGMYVCPENCA